MKKYQLLCLFIIFPFLFSCSAYKANYKVYNTMEKTEKTLQNGFIYALPQTVLKIDVLVEKKEYIKGPYAEYSRILIGVDPKSANNTGFYTLKDVQLYSYTEPDPKAYFFVETSGEVPAISTLSNGIIHSINYSSIKDSPDHNPKSVLLKRIKTESTDKTTFLEPTGSFNYVEKKDSVRTPVFIEDGDIIYETSYQTVAVEKPVGERAKDAANALFEVRLKKKELLYGEYEDPYSRNSIEYIYDHLDRMEKELLELFTGKRVSVVETKSFFIVPDKSLLVGDEQMLILCKFSPEKGAYNADEEGGELVYATLRCEQDLYVINNFLKRKQNSYNSNGRLVKKGKDESRGFVFRIPDLALVKVNCGSRLFSDKITINQYGSLVKLPHTRIKAYFNTETGNIIQVESFRKNSK